MVGLHHSRSRGLCRCLHGPAAALQNDLWTHMCPPSDLSKGWITVIIELQEVYMHTVMQMTWLAVATHILGFVPSRSIQDRIKHGSTCSIQTARSLQSSCFSKVCLPPPPHPLPFHLLPFPQASSMPLGSLAPHFTHTCPSWCTSCPLLHFPPWTSPSTWLLPDPSFALAPKSTLLLRLRPTGTSSLLVLFVSHTHKSTLCFTHTCIRQPSDSPSRMDAPHFV